MLRPSHALVRAALLLAVAGLLTLLTHQVALLVLVAPFAAWCALGVLRRPPRTVPEPSSALSARRLVVGSVAEHVVEAPGWVLDVEVPRPLRCELEPPLGAVVAADRTVVRVQPQRWGRHTVTPAPARLTDDWGLWRGSWRPVAQAFTVAPARDAPGGSEAVPHPVGLVGIHPSRVRGEGSALAEVRAFRTGDRLRRINWRVTSRTGELHTNATTAERDTELLVVTDTLSDVAGDGAGASSLDLTVLAAAAVSGHYLGLGDRVGLHDLGRVIGSVPPGAGARQRTRITEQLASATVERIDRSVVRRVHRVRPGSLVVVCSPLLDADVLLEVLRLVHRGAAVLAVDTLPPELGRLDDTPRGGAASALDALAERFRPGRFWEEAWALRRLERDVELSRLAELGVPVVPWRGLEGLGLVVGALAANRTAPRLSRSLGGGGR
ncbi:DUF58 domain-containing protein [Auraticoccus monumenti]|uniref:DUF58 domain-containing protein n=1 Tax=Auraticoccus monumenti TaxID=675864 RepID=UPI0015618487|nr:DUF58 domain-containing protein [Auraticoccus monumenti]